MFKMLLADEGANTGSGFASYIGIGLLLILLAVYLFFGFKNRKKQQEEALKMMSELKKGDKVVTNAGIYGEIVSMRETDMGRVITIKTGEEGSESFLTLNASVILGIDKKKDLVLNENGEVVDDLKEKNQADDENNEAVLEEEAIKAEKPKKARKSKKDENM